MTVSKPSNAPTNALPSLPTPIPTPLPTPLPTPSNCLPTGCVPTPYNPQALEAPSRAHSTRLPTRLRWRCAWVETLSVGYVMTDESGWNDLVIGNCVLRAQNGGLSTRQQRRGFRANAILEYQCRNRRHGARGTPLLRTRPRMPLKALSFALRRDKATSKATVKSHVGRGFRRVVAASSALVERKGREGQAIGNGSADEWKCPNV
jgi:hypothetical protein